MSENKSFGYTPPALHKMWSDEFKWDCPKLWPMSDINHNYSWAGYIAGRTRGEQIAVNFRKNIKDLNTILDALTLQRKEHNELIAAGFQSTGTLLAAYKELLKDHDKLYVELRDSTTLKNATVSAVPQDQTVATIFRDISKLSSRVADLETKIRVFPLYVHAH